MTATTAPSQTSKLLTIPGEIRNRIYELAIADVLEKATLPGLAHPQRKARTIRDAQSLTRNWRLFRRSFFGLTQVCRQLCEEFLPVHQSRIRITVRLSELKAYFATFVHDTKIANIKIQLDDTIDPTEMRDEILLCATSPRILIDFGCNLRSRMGKVLTYPEDYVKFYEYLAEYTERILAMPWSLKLTRQDGMTRTSAWIAGLDVYVKKELAPVWMNAPLNEKNKPYLKRWRAELGLPVGIKVIPLVG
ncbi:hypothetical protein M3J07_012251 [Ascochyta lentis]